MADRADSAETLRRQVDKMLLAGGESNLHNFFNTLIHWCRQGGVAFNGREVLQYWWHLARTGVVAVPGAKVEHGTQMPCFLLTERGRALLQRGETSPHDPKRYFDSVRKRVASPDDVAMKYLDEAVGAWAAGLCRASAVMVGCACERLVLLLAEKIAAADLASWSVKAAKELAKAPVGISGLFDLIRDCLLDMRRQKKLPGHLADALDRKLSAVFDHARGLRNRSGHPTAEDVSSEDAEASLLLFPGFYALVDGLCQAIRGRAANNASAEQR